MLGLEPPFWVGGAGGRRRQAGVVFTSVAYGRGYRVAREVMKSFDCVCLAADQGLLEAHVLLGERYYSGRPDVLEDKAVALNHSWSASKARNAEATHLVGHCYCEGQGVDENYTETLRCTTS